MKIQVTVLALLVATLAAYDAAPVEEGGPTSEPPQSIADYAQNIADSARNFLRSVAENPTFQSGREWVSTQLEKLPVFFRKTKQELAQKWQELTRRNDDEQ